LQTTVQVTVIVRPAPTILSRFWQQNWSAEMSTDSVLEFLDDRALCGPRASTIDRYPSVLDRLEADTGKGPLRVTHQELEQ